MKAKVTLLFSLIGTVSMLACQLGTVVISTVTPAPAVQPAYEISMPTPLPPTPQLSTVIPETVEGTVIDRPLPDMTVDPLIRTYRVQMQTALGELTVPVSGRTFNATKLGYPVRLDCHELPCVRDMVNRNLVTGVVVDAPQDRWIVTLDINGRQQTFDVDPLVSMSLWRLPQSGVGSTITLDCTDLPCTFAEGE